MDLSQQFRKFPHFPPVKHGHQYLDSFHVSRRFAKFSTCPIIHRILNCNEKLYKCKIKPNNGCDECGEVDIIEHHLFYCKTSTTFWNQLRDWTICNLRFGIELTVCEVSLEFPLITIPTSKSSIF